MEIVTPSTETATDGQISKITQNLATSLVKRRIELPKNILQEVLGDETLVDEMYALVHDRIEVRSSFVICTAKVDRARTPKQVLDATKRGQPTGIGGWMEAMPRGEGSEVEVIFFKPPKRFYNKETIYRTSLLRAYNLAGLIPVDPYSLAAVNEADPAFTKTYPNLTFWKSGEGDRYVLLFDEDNHSRSVYLNQDGGFGTNERWWFAGLRKKN